MSNTLNIIQGNMPERIAPLMKALEEQGIEQIEFWNGVHDQTSVVKSINLSHKQIVEYAMLAGWESVLIAEDDLRFYDKGAYDYFIQHTPLVYDIYLSSIYVGIVKPDNTVDEFSGLHLYRVHKSFYETFLSMPDDCHLDRALGGHGIYVVCDRFVAYQANGVSANTGKHEEYQYLMEGRPIYKNN